MKNKDFDMNSAKEAEKEKKCFGFCNKDAANWICIGCIVKEECLEEMHRRE